MIGDSWEADIIGARNFGIDQVYFNPSMEKIAGEELYFASDSEVLNNKTLNSTYTSKPKGQPLSNKSSSTLVISNLPELINIL